jgi:hypothetical protein
MRDTDEDDDTYDTLYLFNQVRTPDPHWAGDKTTKAYQGKGGYKGTAIAPATIIAMGTELWGPMGLVLDGDYPSTIPVDGWGFRLVSSTYSETEHTAVVELWYPRKCSDGKTRMSYTTGIGCTPLEERDTQKKSFTDGCSNAAYRAGFAIDVYMGKYDDLAYVESRKHALTKNRVGADPTVAEVAKTLRDPFLTKEGFAAAVQTIRGLDKPAQDYLRGLAIEAKQQLAVREATAASD